MFKGMEMRIIEYGSAEYEKSIDIRNKEFRAPQGFNIRDEDLTGDKEMDMYGGYIDNNLMALIFLKEYDKKTGQAKSVIVVDGYKNKGYGTYLMHFIEDRAREKGYTEMIVTARQRVEEFYQKLNYKTISEPFMYYLNPIIYMKKTL